MNIYLHLDHPSFEVFAGFIAIEKSWAEHPLMLWQAWPPAGKPFAQIRMIHPQNSHRLQHTRYIPQWVRSYVLTLVKVLSQRLAPALRLFWECFSTRMGTTIARILLDAVFQNNHLLKRDSRSMGEWIVSPMQNKSERKDFHTLEDPMCYWYGPCRIIEL